MTAPAAAPSDFAWTAALRLTLAECARPGAEATAKRRAAVVEYRDGDEYRSVVVDPEVLIDLWDADFLRISANGVNWTSYEITDAGRAALASAQ